MLVRTGAEDAKDGRPVVVFVIAVGAAKCAHY
jgi:hypothetical protein